MTVTAVDLNAIPLSLGGLLRTRAAEFPETEVVFPDERMTLVELSTRADAFAAMFLQAGVQPGQTVGLWLPPSLDLIAAIFGCVGAGGVAVPISDRFRARELRYVVGHAQMAVIVVPPANGHFDRPAELLAALDVTESQTEMLNDERFPHLRHLVVVTDDAVDAPFISSGDLGLVSGSDGPPPAAVGGGAFDAPLHPIAYLMYTSGTSADPKACEISHQGVLLQADSLAFHRYLLDSDCAFWCPLPLFHNAGLATMTASITAGAKFVHAGLFEPGQALRALDEEKVTHGIPAFETIWMRILDHPDFATTDLSNLRVVLNTGGEDLLRKLQARVPHVAQVANYGLTEATGHLTMTRTDDPLDVRVTTGGYPLPGMEVSVIDPETGEPAPAGQQGEIIFRGPSRFVSYYRDPEATARSIDADGWFHSGDLGVLDADGRLTFKGRLKDMLKVGGENVASLEVESYLLRHPGVNVAAVVGAPDSYYGEVPVAYIERAPGADVSAEEIIDFCTDQIATFKIPRYVRFVEEWPMSGTKIRKFVLREQIAAELAQAGITSAPRISSTRARAIR